MPSEDPPAEPAPHGLGAPVATGLNVHGGVGDGGHCASSSGGAGGGGCAEVMGEDWKDHSAGEVISLQARQTFIDLILWKHTPLTGGLFATMNIFFVMTHWLDYTVMMLLGELTLLALAFSVACHSVAWCYMRLAKRRLVDRLQECTPVNLAGVEKAALCAPLSFHGYARPLAGAVEGGLTVAIGSVREALLLKTWSRVWQCALTAYAMTKLGRHIEAFTLSYLLLLFLFTVPAAWQGLMRQAFFRQQVDTVRQYGWRIARVPAACEVGWSAWRQHVFALTPAWGKPRDEHCGEAPPLPLNRRLGVAGGA